MGPDNSNKEVAEQMRLSVKGAGIYLLALDGFSRLRCRLEDREVWLL